MLTSRPKISDGRLVLVLLLLHVTCVEEEIRVSHPHRGPLFPLGTTLLELASAPAMQTPTRTHSVVGGGFFIYLEQMSLPNRRYEIALFPGSFLFLRREPENEARCERALIILSCLSPPQVKLVCTAAVPPQELFRARLQHSRDEQASRVLLDDLEIAEVSAYTEGT